MTLHITIGYDKILLFIKSNYIFKKRLTLNFCEKKKNSIVEISKIFISVNNQKITNNTSNVCVF